MGFEIEKLDLEGMLLIHAHVANDNRGFYRKNFERNIFAENGLDFSVTEWSDIYSHKGAIRGLHFQTGESQAKLLHVIKGAIYDVAASSGPESRPHGFSWAAGLPDSRSTGGRPPARPCTPWISGSRAKEHMTWPLPCAPPQPLPVQRASRA